MRMNWLLFIIIALYAVDCIRLVARIIKDKDFKLENYTKKEFVPFLLTTIFLIIILSWR